MNRVNVLLVNDRPEQLLALEAVLGDLGHNLVRASSGSEALRKLLHDDFAVILLDVNMPGMDGFETATLIRQRERSASTPIIFVTAHSTQETDVARGYALGAVDYVSAPVVPTVLRSKVSVFVDLFERREQVRQQLSQLQEVQAEIERERATLAAVMGSMSDGLVMLDGAARIRYCNARVGGLLRVAPESLLGLTAEQAFAELAAGLADPEATHQAWNEALRRSADQVEFEMSLTGPPQRDLLVQSFEVTEPDGQARGTGIVLRDVTAERDLERTKDELVSVVSHELRTPLASLVGFAELLLTRNYGEDERRRFLSVILQEGHRLTALINDFLDLQRMESGRQRLVLAPVSIRSLIERAVMGAGEDPERPIVLAVPEHPPMVRADGDRVLQILANLLSNARKYSPGGGEVVISAEAKEMEVEISVTDHGLGMPPEALPRLFEKFYRIDNSDRREIKGTGLGLAICRQIVASHGGQIWAESEGLGRGSRFSFTLPLAESSVEAGEVLIVEDEPGFAHLVAVELAAQGVSAEWTVSGREALQRIDESAPLAIVLDLLLPDIAGEDVLASLRERQANIPVVIVTVKDLTPRELRALRRAGAVEVFRKGPNTAQKAATAIAQLVDQPKTVGGGDDG